MTGLMYNRRVPKCHPRVEAYGTVDELNAGLGLARSFSTLPEVNQALRGVQGDLLHLMGELATAVEDLPRYSRDGYPRLTDEAIAGLDELVRQVEAQGLSFKGWATPGHNPASAALDVARTICRRAERCVCQLQDSNQLENPQIIIYLNRLSDLLWLFARQAESIPDQAT